MEPAPILPVDETPESSTTESSITESSTPGGGQTSSTTESSTPESTTPGGGQTTSPNVEPEGDVLVVDDEEEDGEGGEGEEGKKDIGAESVPPAAVVADPPPQRLLIVKREDVLTAVDSFRFYYNAVISKSGGYLTKGRIVCKMLMVSDVPVLMWCGSIASLSRHVRAGEAGSSWNLDLIPTTLEPVRWISDRAPENHVMWVIAGVKDPMGNEHRFDDVHLLGSFMLSEGITEHVLYRIPHVYEFRMRGLGKLPKDEIVAMRVDDFSEWVSAMGDEEVLVKKLSRVAASGELGALWVRAYLAGKLRPAFDTNSQSSSSSSSSSSSPAMEAAAATMRSAMSDLAPVLRRTPVGVLAHHPDLANILALTSGSTDSIIKDTRIAPIQVQQHIADAMTRHWKGSEPWTSTENVRAVMGNNKGAESGVGILDVLASWEERNVLDNAHPEIQSKGAVQTILTYDSLLRSSTQAWKWIILNHGPVDGTNLGMLPIHYPIEAVIHIMRDPETPVGWFTLLSREVPIFIANRKKRLAAVTPTPAAPSPPPPSPAGSVSVSAATPPTPWMDRAARIVKSQPDAGLVGIWEVLRDLDMEEEADRVIDLVGALKSDTPPRDNDHSPHLMSLLLCSIFYAPHLFTVRGKVAQFMVSHRERLSSSFHATAKALTDESSVEIHPLGVWRVRQVYEWLVDRIDPFRVEEELATV